ncbi:hypothetical protein PILCRDRAFT_826995 [Piloderma croceum F 1598]|uniref:Uncharacterized protein n=1 Tax=Piloderma croceum (strain F 1598) TaxID=765440 RepID=A0A0C3F714_PILCF|nr:hypothetical protein PILCRDRAFT_826995 [Piloderma croceum F 1598]
MITRDWDFNIEENAMLNSGTICELRLANDGRCANVQFTLPTHNKLNRQAVNQALFFHNKSKP